MNASMNMSVRASMRVIVAVLLAMSAACRHHAQTTANASPGVSPVMTLERGACRGRCPEYRVQVFENGKVMFDGQKNVTALGAHTGTASTKAIRALMDAVAASDFAKIDTAYTYGSKSCGQYYTDLPVAILSAKVGSRMKTVHHDPGCRGAPELLKSLAARVDTVAGTSQWVNGSGGSSK